MGKTRKEDSVCVRSKKSAAVQLATNKLSNHLLGICVCVMCFAAAQR